MKNINQTSGAAALFQFFCRDKEHAALSAFASVAHGVEVKTTEDHVNRAAGRGCHGATCSAGLCLLIVESEVKFCEITMMSSPCGILTLICSQFH